MDEENGALNTLKQRPLIPPWRASLFTVGFTGKLNYPED